MSREIDPMIFSYLEYIQKEITKSPMTSGGKSLVESDVDLYDNLIVEALNELGEVEEVEELAEAVTILSLLEQLEEAESLQEGPLAGKIKGASKKGTSLERKLNKSSGVTDREAFLTKIMAKAEKKRAYARDDAESEKYAKPRSPGAKKRKEAEKRRAYWDTVGDRAAALERRLRNRRKPGASDAGDAKISKQTKEKQKKMEGSRGKKPGDTWKTGTGHYGGKNRQGEIRYFDSEDKARNWAKG